MSRNKKDLYKQVELIHPNNFIEVCWIPEHLAIKDEIVHFKKENFDAKVKTVYNATATLEEIDVNRNFPLKDQTDI